MITKSVFLIMYLWHTAGGGQSSVGGPAMTVTPMPSLVVCEKVGIVVKTFADEQMKSTSGMLWVHAPPKPAEFRCIEVDDAAPQPQVKCSTK